jgi:hypothetical protein
VHGKLQQSLCRTFVVTVQKMAGGGCGVGAGLGLVLYRRATTQISSHADRRCREPCASVVNPDVQITKEFCGFDRAVNYVRLR